MVMELIFTWTIIIVSYSSDADGRAGRDGRNIIFEGADFLDTQLKRHARYAEILGTFYFSRGPFRLSVVPSATVSVFSMR